MSTTHLSLHKVLDGVTAANSPPTSDRDGIKLPRHWDDLRAIVKSVAGSGTMTATVKVWVYGGGDIDDWFPLGTNGTAALKGVLNEANALDETGTDSIHHTELITGLLGWDRVYFEVTAIGGTATAIDAWVGRAKREGK